MAAIQLAVSHGNATTTSAHSCIEAVTTTNTTPTLWTSIPVAQNKIMNVEVRFSCRRNDYSNAYGGEVNAIFIRGTGNISVQGSSISSIITGIAGLKPSIVLTANTSTQSIDITVTGLAATTLVWSGHIDIIFNT